MRAIIGSILVLAACGLSVFLAFRGYHIFPNNIHDDKKRIVSGCYGNPPKYILKITEDYIYVNGASQWKYHVISDKLGLSISPERQLLLHKEHGGGYSVVLGAGSAKLIGYNDQTTPSLIMFDEEDVQRVLPKIACNNK